MRVGVIQSSFIPWRGYFDFIASVDLFVFHDDLQFTKGDWRNRNRIKTPQGTRWLTVPVHYRSVAQRICDTAIDESTDWLGKHRRLWQAHYRNAPYFRDVLEILHEATQVQKEPTISALNIALIRKVMEYLSISTPLAMSSEFDLHGTKTERLIDLLSKLGASRYLSGPSAEGYLDKAAFRSAGIGLEYKTYDYLPYPQLWGEFDGLVTVLDLIANCGPDAKSHFRSLTPDLEILQPGRQAANICSDESLESGKKKIDEPDA